MATDPSPERFRELMLDEEPSLPEVMACVFDVQDHEVRTYRSLLDQPGSTVEELAAVLDRDRSNVNRSLSTLREKGLARRERRLLEGAATFTSTIPPRRSRPGSRCTRRWTSGRPTSTTASTSSAKRNSSSGRWVPESS